MVACAVNMRRNHFDRTMNTPLLILLPRLALAALAAVGFSSCTVYDDGYYGGGPRYGGGYVATGVGYGYDDWNDEYYDYHPPTYSGYVTYATRWPHYYGGRYYSYRWWDDDRYGRYRHDHGSNRDRYRHRRSSEEMKLVRYRGPQRGELPSGYHSKEWYRDRGISLKDNTFRERDGEVRGRQPSSSSRSKKDDRPSSEHPRAMRQPDKYRHTGSGGSSRNDVRRGSEPERRSSSSSSSSSSASRNRGDDRPTSEHPRALRQPEKYRYTGGEKRSSKSKKD